MKEKIMKKIFNKLDLTAIICLCLGELLLILNMILMSLKIIENNMIYWLIVIFPYFLSLILAIISLICETLNINHKGSEPID